MRILFPFCDNGQKNLDLSLTFRYIFPVSGNVAPNEKVIYFHGFDRQEMFTLLDAIKKLVPNPREIAFATSTKNNLELKVSEMVREVRKDHNYMILRTGPKPED